MFSISGPETSQQESPQMSAESDSLLDQQTTAYGTIDYNSPSDSTVTLTRRTWRKIIMFLLFSWGVCLLLGYLANFPLGTESQQAARRKWAQEDNERVIIRQNWLAEVHAHEDLRRMWTAEAQGQEELRRQWAFERAKERQSKEESEKKAQEELDAKRASLNWDGLESGNCLRYGVRRYTATLSHVPLGLDSFEECHQKAGSIHGRDWTPVYCEDRGVCGRVTGHFDVDTNEPGCSPWWANFYDKGCVQNGIRRHEASLENLQDTTYWEDVCMTTPRNIGNKHYASPTSCANWQKHGGVWAWGIWEVEDETCK